MKLIAMFALFAIAIACAKDEAAPATGDTGKTPSEMPKSGDDMKKKAEEAGMPSAEMRTVTFKIDGMT